MLLGTYLMHQYKEPKLMQIFTAGVVPLPAAARERLLTPAVPPKAAPVVYDTAVSTMLDYEGPRLVFSKLTANVFTHKRALVSYDEAPVRRGWRGRAYRGRCSWLCCDLCLTGG